MSFTVLSVHTDKYCMCGQYQITEDEPQLIRAKPLGVSSRWIQSQGIAFINLPDDIRTVHKGLQRLD